jgi:hypothetical protein
VLEVDLEAQREAVVRRQARPLELLALALAHLHRLEHAQELARRLLPLDAGALQQVDEGGSRAVEDRHFLGRDVDVEVVQPQAGAGRHQVLHRTHLGVAHRQRGGQPGVGDGLRVHGDVHRLRQVNAAKHDAGVRRRRPQRQFDTLAAVQAHAHRARQRLQCSLRKHGVILRNQQFWR